MPTRKGLRFGTCCQISCSTCSRNPVSCVSVKLRFIRPALPIAAERFHLYLQTATVKPIIPQTLGRTHQQLPDDRRGSLDASVFRRQHMLVADARACGPRAGDIRPMQKLVHLGASHPAPNQP